MKEYQEQSQSGVQEKSRTAIFMQHVYTWMTAALGVTAVSAYLTASSPALIQAIYGGGMFVPIILMIALFGLVMYITANMQNLSSQAATGLFLLYAALMGVFLGPTLLIYTSSSVATAFVVTAGMFGGMSIYGTVTKRDLTGMGNFLIMGLWGIILASIVNIFLQNTMMDFVISVIGVIIFTGLTAYDTQKIREMGENAPLNDATAIRRGAILGALTLYLDFINLFLMLLRLLGNRE